MSTKKEIKNPTHNETLYWEYGRFSDMINKQILTY